MTEEKNTKDVKNTAGHRMRLLNRYINNSISALEDYEMLELLLHFGIPHRDTKQQAKELISHFGGIEKVFCATVSEIENVKLPYITQRVAALIMLVRDIQKKLEFTSMCDTKYLKDVSDAGKYAVSVMTGKTNESFYVVNLTSTNKIIHTELIATGTEYSVDIVMSKIINSVVLHGAAKVMLLHNHSSGNSKPSLDDLIQTRYIERRLDEIGISLSDHIIVSNGKYTSMRSRGFI